VGEEEVKVGWCSGSLLEGLGASGNPKTPGGLGVRVARQHVVRPLCRYHPAMATMTGLAKIDRNIKVEHVEVGQIQKHS
jgi:hypothetical protein